MTPASVPGHHLWVPLDTAQVDLSALTLSGRRLRLRPWCREDAATIVAACSDPASQRWLPNLPAPYTEADARWFLREVVAPAAAAGRAAHLAVDDLVGGHVVASVSIGALAEQPGNEIGYWVAPWARGHGYAAEATDVLARWAFGVGQHRVYLYADVDNLASVRTAERAGFRREGVLRGSHLDRDGVPKDMSVYGRLSVDPAPVMIRG